MEHNDIRHMLSEYLDGSVPPQEKTEIEEHLKTCPECRNALTELKRTIEHIKAVEEIEPPAWMTQKIMAKVRTEAGKKKHWAEKLFFPLCVKLPIEAAALVFLTIGVIAIYENMQPMQKFAEAPLPSMQKEIARQEAPAANLEVKKTDESTLRSKQLSRAQQEKSQEIKQEYEAYAPSVRKETLAKSAPAPAAPAEQPTPQKDEMMLEKRAASQAPALGMVQEDATVTTGSAASQAKVESKTTAPSKKAKKFADKAETVSRLERTVVERHSNSKPKLVFTYKIIDSQKIKLVEERFNAAGERHGMQKEYYSSGKLKMEAAYGSGKLNWYMEYGPDGIKKIGKTDYDWFWLKK